MSARGRTPYLKQAVDQDRTVVNDEARCQALLSDLSENENLVLVRQLSVAVFTKAPQELDVISGRASASASPHEYAGLLSKLRAFGLDQVTSEWIVGEWATALGVTLPGADGDNGESVLADPHADDGDVIAALSDLAVIVRANPRDLMGAVLRFRHEIPAPVGPMLERSVHLFEGLDPAQRWALLDLTARQELIEGPGSPPGDAAWKAEWTVWQPSSPHVTLSRCTRGRVVALAPDATYAAVARYNDVRVWDLQSDQHKESCSGHLGPVYVAAFSHDHQRLVTGSHDRTVRLWNPETGICMQVFEGHDDDVTAVAVSADGTTVASASADRTVRLWDAFTGQQVNKVPCWESIRMLVVGPERRTVATAASANEVQVWDGTKEALRSPLGTTNPITALSISPDGELLGVVGADGSGELWCIDGELQLLTRVDRGVPITALAFSNEGSLIAAASADRTIRIHDRSMDELRETLVGQYSAAEGIAFSCDGATIASLDEVGVVQLWQRAEAARQDENGDRPRVPPGARAMAMARSRERLAIVGDGEGVRLFDVTGQYEGRLAASVRFPCALAFSPDGTRLATAGGNDDTLRLWALDDNGEEVAKCPQAHTVDAVAFAAAEVVVTASREGDVGLWDPTAPNDAPDRLARLAGRVRSLCASPDARWVAAGSDDSLCVWELVRPGLSYVVRAPVSPVSALAFSPTGSMLASGHADATAYLRTCEGHSRGSLREHEGAVSAVGFSPSGRRLATGSADGILRLFDGFDESAELVPVLSIPVRSPIHGLAWVDDRQVVVATSAGLAMLSITSD